jgi:hypothetical protein
VVVRIESIEVCDEVNERTGSGDRMMCCQVAVDPIRRKSVVTSEVKRYPGGGIWFDISSEREGVLSDVAIVDRQDDRD